MDDDFAGLDFGDFRSDEGGGVFHARLLVEFATALADEAAGERALVEADRELVAEAGEHRPADGRVAGFEIHRRAIPAETLG